MKTIKSAGCATILYSLLVAGCGETPPVPDPPLTSSRYVSLTLEPKAAVENIVAEKVVVGLVGQPIERRSYQAQLEVSNHMELQCKLSYHTLHVPQTPYTNEGALNFSVKGVIPNSPEPRCREAPIVQGKEISCSFEQSGVARLRVESAHPQLVLGFGFICKQVPLPPPVEIAVAPRRPIPSHTPKLPSARPKEKEKEKEKDTADSNGGEKITAAPSIAMRLVGSSDGKDDSHKVLTLAPCKSPLNGARGKAVLAGLRRPYTTVSAKSCEIEVANVPESSLAIDLPVTLVP